MGRHPDADVYPHATGAAAALVAAHEASAELKLYGGWFCPFVQRVLLVLIAKRIPFQYIEVNPYDKPASLMRLNPRGLVPTLELPLLHPTTPLPSSSSSTSTSIPTPPPRSLFESSVICAYLDEVYNDPAQHGRPLLAADDDAYERARARIWIGFVDTAIIPAWHRWLQLDGEAATAGRREFWAAVSRFVGQMDPRGPFWAGAAPGLPDVAFAPWVARMWVFAHFGKGDADTPPEEEEESGGGGGSGGGEGEGVAAAAPRGSGGGDGGGGGGRVPGWWDRWLVFRAAVEGWDAVRDTTSDKENYLPLYRRYAENKAQSEAAKAIRAGRPIP